MDNDGGGMELLRRPPPCRPALPPATALMLLLEGVAEAAWPRRGEAAPTAAAPATAAAAPFSQPRTSAWDDTNS